MTVLERSTRPAFHYYGPQQVRRAIGFERVIEPVAEALADFSRGAGEAPVLVFAPQGRDGDVHVKSAWLPGRAIFIVKVATWFAARGARGDPPGAGFVAAFDARTGDLCALLDDDHHLSDVRTAAAGALAARFLAVREASVLGVLGTGVQAYLQALAAAAERPVETVRIWGRHRERAERLARALGARRPGLAIHIVERPRQACEGAQIVVTATASSDPLVEGRWMAPGVLVTAVGADDVRKCELEPACFAVVDRIVVDSRVLSSQFGDVAHAVRLGAIEPSRISAELGEVVAGTAAGRSADEEAIICKLIGLGVQDLAATEVALEALRDGSARERYPASALDLRRNP